MILIKRTEGITEVRVQEPTVGIVIVPSHEGVDVVFVAVLAELLENVVQVGSCQPALLFDVEHLEGVHEVEVALDGEANAGFFHFALVVDEVFDDGY